MSEILYAEFLAQIADCNSEDELDLVATREKQTFKRHDLTPQEHRSLAAKGQGKRFQLQQETALYQELLAYGIEGKTNQRAWQELSELENRYVRIEATAGAPWRAKAVELFTKLGNELANRWQKER